MKNKLIPLIIVFASMPNIVTAVGLVNNFDYLTRRWSVSTFNAPQNSAKIQEVVSSSSMVDALEASKNIAIENKQLSDLSKDATNFLQAQDRFAQQISESNRLKAYKASVASFENEGGAVSGRKILSTPIASVFVKSEDMCKKSASSAARLASNAKIAVVAVPAAVVAGGLYALDYGQSLKGTEMQLVVEKESLIEQHIQNSIVQNIKNKNNIVSTNSTVLSKAAHVKNALLNVGSSVKTQVLAHPRIATGAGLATIAGLSYVAYKNFGKATAKPVVETKKAVKAAPVVSTPTKAPKRRLPGGYARRR